MADTTMPTALAATLSQSELFLRYLDAQVRVGATTSTLIEDHGTMFDTTARDWFLQYGEGDFLPSDYAAEILGQIEGDEFPLFELEKIIGDLSDLLEALKTMSLDFSRLAHATRSEQPDDEASDEVYRDWEDNPRYVLPLTEEEVAS